MVERSSKPKRPRDVSQRAKIIVDIATGEVDSEDIADKKKPLNTAEEKCEIEEQ